MNDVPVKVVCAWCGATIADPSADLPPWRRPELPVSHGICPACYAEQEVVLAGMGPAPANAGKAGGEG